LPCRAIHCRMAGGQRTGREILEALTRRVPIRNLRRARASVARVPGWPNRRRGYCMASCRLPSMLARTRVSLVRLFMELRQHLALVKVEERLLVGTNLVHINVIEAGLGVLLDALQVLTWVLAAHDRLGHVIFADEA